MLFGTILHIGQSYIGVLFCAMCNVRPVYFSCIVQGYSNALFGTVLHIGQTYIGVLFRETRKIVAVYFFMHCARLQNVLFGTMLERRFSVTHLCKSTLFCDFVHSENSLFNFSYAGSDILVLFCPTLQPYMHVNSAIWAQRNFRNKMLSFLVGFVCYMHIMISGANRCGDREAVATGKSPFKPQFKVE